MPVLLISVLLQCMLLVSFSLNIKQNNILCIHAHVSSKSVTICKTIKERKNKMLKFI